MSFHYASSSARPRRIDDALSQLVDAFLPPLSLSALGDDYSDDEAEDALAAAEERRHRDMLERAWRILDSHTADAAANNNDPSAPSSASAAGGRRGSLMNGDNINNASDLIKRKLLRENASPDKAVRFSNLYSRLLTQPVLGQKWAILYLLYKLSDSGGEDGNGVDEAERSRTPLMEEGNLENMLFKSRSRGRTGTGISMLKRGEDVDDDGPAISSSVSQRGLIERNASMRREKEREREREREREKLKEKERDRRRSLGEAVRESTRASRSQTESRSKDAPSAKGEQVSAGSPTSQKRSSADGETGLRAMKPSESTLLRDLPYNLQGLSSANLEFASPSILKLPQTLPIPILSLLHTLAEPCLLYKGLSTFVEGSDGGLISQSLRAAVGNELRSYLGLVATLEGEIRRALAAVTDQNEPKGVVKGGVTLKRCVIWTRDATMALRLMSLIVEEAKSKLEFLFYFLIFYRPCTVLTRRQTRKEVN